jgi:hypothetical protein
MKEIQEQILKYFENVTEDKLSANGNYWSFKVLDNKYKRYYTGVTLQYICYELFKAKYRKSDVAEALLDLWINHKIKFMFCRDVKKNVFCTKHCIYTNLYDQGFYKYQQIELSDYLKSFIIK